PFQSVGWAEPPRPAGACHRTGHKPDPLGRPDGRLRVPTLSSFTWALRDPSRSPQERAFAHSPVSATHRDLPRHRHLPRSIRMRRPADVRRNRWWGRLLPGARLRASLFGRYRTGFGPPVEQRRQIFLCDRRTVRLNLPHGFGEFDHLAIGEGLHEHRNLI